MMNNRQSEVMTREEEIKKYAKELGQKYFPNSHNIWARPNIEAQCIEKAFIEGAKWADNNPQMFKGQTEKMEEREIAFMDWWLENHKGKLPTFADAIAWADKTMVEKACEWLSTETYSYTWVSYDQYESGVMKDKLLNDFRKAMEE